MYIQFDPKSMHLQVICGSLENYKPDSEMEELQKKVEELKAKLVKFQEEEVKPELDKITEMVEQKNKAQTEKSENK